MKHLCYVYIYKYKALKDIELAFDAHYRFHFDKETHILHIDSNNDMLRDFWGKGIYALSGLIGDNGTGKSTAMCFLLEALVSGANKDEVDGIVVYEMDGKLYVYKNEHFGKIKCKGIEVTPSKLFKINTFYYSGHFSPYTSSDDLRCIELKGSYIASESCRLVNDAEDYLNVEALHLTRPMWYYLNAFVVQNNYRICSLLADTRLVKSFKEFKLPRKVLVTVNRSGKQAFNIENLNKKEEEKYQLPYENTVTRQGKGVIEEWLIYHNLVNAMRDENRRQRIRELLENWLAIVNGNDEIIKQFESFVNDNEDHDDEMILTNILSSLKALENLAHYNENLGAFYFDIFDDHDNFNKFVNEVLGTRYFVINRFADLSYCHSLDDEGPTILSSGEQQMLNLFSRIYDAVEGKLRKTNEPTSLLLLDEAEMGFHPEWQRRYIHLIVSFLSNLLVPLRFNFQIIITTHSPILLSDIPKCCTNYLKRNNDITLKVNDDKVGETFAANVFNLYRMSFFMEDGLVGEFARKKIKNLSKKIDRGKTKDVQNEINMIGDIGIREYLLEKYYKKHPDDKSLNEDIIRYYKNRIAQLEALKAHKKDE